MNLTENKRSTLVGIFVLVALIIFIAAIFVLGGQQKRFVQTVTIKAIFDNVEGLKVGNNIQFSGVKIGTVRSINFFGNSQVEVEMRIEEVSRPYIHKDATARIGSESLIGNRMIVISGGTPQVPAIEDGDVLKVESPMNTDAMMATLQKNNQNLAEITGDIKVLSSRLVRGQGLIGAALGDSMLADNFRSVVANLQAASATTSRAAGALSQFSAKLNNPNGLVNTLLTDTAVFNQLESAVAQLKQTTAATAAMTSNLNEVSGKLNQNNNAVNVLLNDPKFADDLKKTMGNLQTSTDELDETMKAVQNNFLLRGYFKRQAIRDAKNADKLKEQEQKDQAQKQ